VQMPMTETFFSPASEWLPTGSACRGR
jgi:hypothetical protein